MKTFILPGMYKLLPVCFLLIWLPRAGIGAQTAGSEYEGIPAEPRHWPEPTHYISPSGSDTDRGTSPGEAWKIFGHALPRLHPGDVLGVMDGVYTPETTGLLHIDGGARGNARTGMPDDPITVRAINERVPLLESDGLLPGIFIVRNRYWNILGFGRLLQ